MKRPFSQDKSDLVNFINYVVEFEVALAEVQQELGVIPPGTAPSIASLRSASINHAELEAGAEQDGMIIPTLIKLLRASIADDKLQWLHYGATSQDAYDTANALIYRDKWQELAGSSRELVQLLVQQAQTHAQTQMAARSRQRSASPTTFGFIVAEWANSLARSRQRVGNTLPDITQLQLGGSSGISPAFDQPLLLSQKVASKLGLSGSMASWQSQREQLATLASTLANFHNVMAKIAQDLLFLSINEVAEITLGNGGGSSTMPHKHNPISLEQIIENQLLITGFAQNTATSTAGTMLRDGRTWLLENQTLSSIFTLVAGSVGLLSETITQMSVNAPTMQHNLNLHQGLLFSESMKFELARRLGPAQAQTIISTAIESLRQSSQTTNLADVVAADPAVAGLNWDPSQCFDLQRELDNAKVYIKHHLSDVEKLLL